MAKDTVMIDHPPARTRSPRKSALLFALLAAAVVLSGCSNRWRATYEPAVGATGAVYPPTERVVVRQVPWERLVPTLDAIQERLIASDVHPSEWDDATRRDIQSRLLETLQFDTDRFVPGETAEVFGVSSFTTTDPVRPGDGQLAEYAQSIGADYVVWADRSLGLRETVVREPVTRHTYYGGWGYGSRRHGRGHSGIGTETVWVPVVVQRENIAFLAFYVRTTPADWAPQGP